MEIANRTYDYWMLYSHPGTWQFWTLLLLFVLPLVALFFFLDRRRALLIGFFGFNIHVWHTYVDLLGTNYGRWAYPYRLFPFMPESVVIDSSLVPVAFMYVYQWTLIRGKNFYGYAAALSLFFAFLVKPALITFGLFEMYAGMNVVLLWISFLFVAVVSKWITDVFLSIQIRGEGESGRREPGLPRIRRWFSLRERVK